MKINQFLLSHSFSSKKLSHKSLQWKKYSRLMSPKSSISTITICTKSSVGSSVRRSELVRRCPKCWRSDASLDSLCQRSEHSLTGCRVRAMDRAARRTSYENGDGEMEALRVLRHVYFTHSTLKSIVRELMTSERNRFLHAFEGPPQAKMDGFH